MNDLNSVVLEIRNLASVIRKIESNASAALYVNNNEEEYRRLMRDKTLLLFSFPEKIEAYLMSIDSVLSKFIRHQIGGFAHGAEKALALNSPFYMSALLYPENYQDGDCNDLEFFLATLEKKIALLL